MRAFVGRHRGCSGFRPVSGDQGPFGTGRLHSNEGCRPIGVGQAICRVRAACPQRSPSGRECGTDEVVSPKPVGDPIERKEEPMIRPDPASGNRRSPHRLVVAVAVALPVVLLAAFGAAAADSLPGLTLSGGQSGTVTCSGASLSVTPESETQLSVSCNPSPPPPPQIGR